MNTYKIKIVNIFGKFVVADWEANNKEEAVKEFLELNPEYTKRGKIIAE